MARYQITLAYDGTNFQGFQRQGKVRTVQAEVESVLKTFGWQGRTILAAGRTDSGVHASGQVIAFDLNWTHGTEALERAMNARLPKDVAVREVSETDGEFHPRFSAHSRTYRYKIFCQPRRNPLLEYHAWRVWPAVELPLLMQAAELLIGRYDFAAFGTPPRADGTTIRTVHQAVWQPIEEGIVFDITADAFLYHMVRRVVFAQILVGQGRLELSKLADAVFNASELPPGLAPANGLCLVKVDFSRLTAGIIGSEFEEDE